MEFTIYRKSWRRGGGSVEGTKLGGVEQCGDTSLLNDHNMFCCLGMVAAQMGVPPIHLIDVGNPEDIEEEYVPNKTILVKTGDGVLTSTKLTSKAITINDQASLSEEKREEKLTQIFSKRGHTLKFVNKVAPKAWRVAG